MAGGKPQRPVYEKLLRGGKREAADTVLELLQSRMFLLPPSGGTLGGDDDPSLQAFVQMAKTYDIKLVLGETNDGREMPAELIAAMQHDPD